MRCTDAEHVFEAVNDAALCDCGLLKLGLESIELEFWRITKRFKIVAIRQTEQRIAPGCMDVLEGRGYFRLPVPK